MFQPTNKIISSKLSPAWVDQNWTRYQTVKLRLLLRLLQEPKRFLRRSWVSDMVVGAIYWGWVTLTLVSWTVWGKPEDKNLLDNMDNEMMISTWDSFYDRRHPFPPPLPACPQHHSETDIDICRLDSVGDRIDSSCDTTHPYLDICFNEIDLTLSQMFRSSLGSFLSPKPLYWHSVRSLGPVYFHF